MKVRSTELDGVVVIEPAVFGDDRGYFLETYQKNRYGDAGIGCDFVQDNASFSAKGVLRGLHLQHPDAQDKLVSVPLGAVFDVAVDVRSGSPTFGRLVGEVLSDENKSQLFVPKGFAHGFCVLSDHALFTYKCSDYYAPDQELSIRWDDPDIGIKWPLADIQVSPKDAAGAFLRDLGADDLPAFATNGQ